MRQRESQPKRVARFLRKRIRNDAKGYDYRDAPDPRQAKKIDHAMESILWSVELALTSNQPTMRDIETLSEQLGGWLGEIVPGRISDTTIDTELRRMDASYLQEKLILRVRDMHRSKMLLPVGLPFGIATIDGKNIATLDHDAAGTGHARSSENKKWHLSPEEEAQRGKTYYLMLALRAVLVSAEAKPVIGEYPLPPGTGEATSFRDFVDKLHDAYGKSGMIRVIDGDAGLISLANADHVTKLGYDYLLGLKGNQKELYAEAVLLLESIADTQAPEVQTDWERRNNTSIRRKLYRSAEMKDFENSAGVWSHLNQTWLVRQETRHQDGRIEIEDRYFLTSLPWDALSPQQILLAVRIHWSIENDAFNSLDLQWREDSAPLCTQGTAIWTLSLLRILAYNAAQLFRRRRLRPKDLSGCWLKPMPWRTLFKIIETALLLDDLEPAPAA